MSNDALDDFDRRVLAAVIAGPRSHAYDINKRLIADWIGNSRLRGWVWILFAPGPGSLYPSLEKLERLGIVQSDWGEPTKSGNRHRLYWYRSDGEAWRYFVTRS